MEFDPLDINEVKSNPLSPVKEEMIRLRPWMLFLGILLGVGSVWAFMGGLETIIEILSLISNYIYSGRGYRWILDILVCIMIFCAFITSIWSAFSHIKYAQSLELYTQTDLDSNFELLAQRSAVVWKTIALTLLFIGIALLMMTFLNTYY